MGLKIRRGSLSDRLLTVLEKTVDGIVVVNDFVNNMRNYSVLGRDYPLKKSTLSKAVARLRQKGLITQEIAEEGETILKLTDQGREEVFLVVKEDSQWDGKWRIVVWDIPEQKRIIRNLFRRNLKKWGFKNLQKSVWISKKNVTDQLFNYVKELRIEKWVWIFESDKYGPANLV